MIRRIETPPGRGGVQRSATQSEAALAFHWKEPLGRATELAPEMGATSKPDGPIVSFGAGRERGKPCGVCWCSS